MRQVELTLIVPMRNEARNLGALLDRVRPVLDRLGLPAEVICVDDGSTDGTAQMLKLAHAVDPRIKAISLSRNFGKEVALAAGLHEARGRAAVLMDADLQHPPELIERFVALWREGWEVVYAQRRDRQADGPLRRWLSTAFYRLFALVGQTELPPGAGDFRLLDRKVIDALNAMEERTRFTKGLYSWVGFRQIGVPYDVPERAGGGSRFSLLGATRSTASRPSAPSRSGSGPISASWSPRWHSPTAASSWCARCSTAPTCPAIPRSWSRSCSFRASSSWDWASWASMWAGSSPR